MLEYEKWYFSTLLESAAESEIYNKKKYSEKLVSKKDFNYSKEREKESLLLLLGICRDNVSLEDYYNAIYDSNLSSFYNFFDANTKEKIYDLYKIIYSIDAASLNNELGLNLQKEISKNFSEMSLEYLVGYGYRIDILKKVLKNMANYTVNNPDFSLEENVVLFDIVKNLITSNAYTVTKR